MSHCTVRSSGQVSFLLGAVWTYFKFIIQDNNAPPSPTCGPRGGKAPTRRSTPTSPNRRPAFRSQIPIPTPLNAQTSYLRSRSQQSQAYRMIDAHMRGVLQPQRPGGKTDSAASAARLASTLATREPLGKSMVIAFDVYGKRLKTDLGQFSMVCSALVREEQQEKEKWKSLCTKVMKERDDARGALEAIAKGPPPSPPNFIKTEREAYHTNVQLRPMRPLPTSRSPSPLSSTGFGYNCTPPPYSTELNDLHISSRTASAPPLGTLFHSPSPPTAKGTDGPPPKRRRSCDLSGAESSLTGTSPPPEWSFPCHTFPQPVCQKPTGAPALPHDFLHVDLMYAQENGLYVCRACKCVSRCSVMPVGEG